MSDMESESEEETGKKAGVDLGSLLPSELNRLKQNKIYQLTKEEYDASSVIHDFFGKFEELEKSDVWKNLNDFQKEYARQVE